MPRQVALPNQVLDMPLPMNGIDVSCPYSAQTPGTTPQAINVRGFDADAGRRRLTRRAGLVKYPLNQLSGSSPIQCLDEIVGVGYLTGGGVFVPGSVGVSVGTVVTGISGQSGQFAIFTNGSLVGYFGDTSGGERFKGAATDGSAIYVTSASGFVSPTNKVFLSKYDTSGNRLWKQTLVSGGAGLSSPWTSRPAVIGSNVYVMAGTNNTSTGPNGLYRNKTSDGSATSSNPWVAEAAIDDVVVPGYGLDFTTDLVANASSQVFATLVADDGSDEGALYVGTSGALSGVGTLFGSNESGFNNFAVSNLASDGVNFYYAGWVQDSTGGAHAHVSAAKLDGSLSQQWFSGNLGGPLNSTPSTTQPATAFDTQDSLLSLSLTAPVSEQFDLLASTGGQTSAGNYGGATSMGYTNSGQFGGITPTKVFFGHKQTIDWSIPATGLSGPILVMSTTGGGAYIGGPSTVTNYNRGITLVGVAGGTVKVLYQKTWQPTINGTTALNTTVAVVRSAVNIGRVYFADGTNYKYYDPTDNTVHPWVATTGQLPIDSQNYKPRLICTWRSRTVLSGLPYDPRNWFMSAVGDPSNWFYNPAPAVETQAVAGNNSPAGTLSDIITALIPYNDDILIFGGDHTIYQMTGDPAAGGRVDRISDITGIAWGNAWTRTPDGTLYFFGSRGAVYKFMPGSLPQKISMALDQPLSQINMAGVEIRLAYDERWLGLHIHITDLTGGPSTHYYYDETTGAWWSDVYGSALFNPFATLVFDGDSPNDRVVLIGGQDGWVRNPVPTALDDDGVAISSTVLCGPLAAGRSLTALMNSSVALRGTGLAVRTSDLQVTLAGTEGSLNWGVQTGNYAEQAALATAQYTGVSAPGRNRSQNVRVEGTHIYVNLSRAVSEPPWSLEALRMTVATLGKVRQRQF